MEMHVVVKNEIELEDDTHTPTIEPLICDVKQEEAASIEVKTEIESTVPLWSGASVEYNNYVTTEQHCGSELVESFVIYEFEPATATEHTFTPTSITEPTPRLLNAKLHMRNKPDVSSLTASTPYIAAASPTASLLQQPSTAVRKRKPSPVVTHAGGAVAALPAKTAPTELKVKCFCRLGKPTDLDVAPANDLELKAFFAQMFDEVRELAREQQRKVKMLLLEAVCQAEEDVEAGKYCEKCCS